MSVPDTGGPAAVPTDPCVGSNAVTAIPATFESVDPVPLIGIPTMVTPPAAAPAYVIQFLRSLGSVGSPSQGPWLPAMARFDTVMTPRPKRYCGRPS